MKIIPIPDTDLKVSSICFGAGQIGSGINREDSFALLDEYISRGGNFLDTAHVYGDWVEGIERSISEKTIGDWIKQRKNRHKIILGTKGGHHFLTTPKVSRLSKSEIVQDLNESLIFLKTECIDLYWLHRDDPQRPAGEILETLNEQVKAGKIRYFGSSNWKTTRLEEADDYAQKHNLIGFSANQPFWNAGVLKDTPYHAADQTSMDAECFAYHLRTGMAAIPFQSQAAGLFHRLQKHTLDQMDPFTVGCYNISETRLRFERICQVMEESGLNLTQVILGYLLSQPFTTIPIIGVRNMALLEDSLSASEVNLTIEQVRFIETGK